MSHTTYAFGICDIRWAVSPRDDAIRVLQFALRPINGGPLQWFDVPTEVLPVAAAIGNKLEKSDE